jgi:hypothetical protein
MIGYFANLVGLGLNFLGTFLLLKYSPESKTTEGWTVTGNFKKELIPVFEGFIKKGSRFDYSFVYRLCPSISGGVLAVTPPKRLPMTYLARQLKAANDQ